MKLRIRGNSLRLRLTRSDLATLLAQGTVSEYMRMNVAAGFEYRLTSAPGLEGAHVRLAGSMLEVRLPRTRVETWASGNEVGIEVRQPNGSAEGLLVLVEKDYPCLIERPNEDDSDAFARPVED